MNFLKRVIRCVIHPSKILIFLSGRGILPNIISDEQYLKLLFKNNMGYKLDLDNPQTFNEKLQWLKLNDRENIYTRLVDKYEVRTYISELVGEEYLIPLLGVWENVDEIEIDKMPKQFVLKCTHDSGSVILVKDKAQINWGDVKKVLSKALKRNYYLRGREWAYKDVHPRIIAEKLMIDKRDEELIDYKLLVFNGKVKCSFTCTERFSGEGLKVTFFDMEWKKMPFERHFPASEKEIAKPENFEKMVRIAEKIAAELTFARVDFYEINGKVYVGEITLYPGDGLEEFRPYEWDLVLGEWIDLPKDKKKV